MGQMCESHDGKLPLPASGLIQSTQANPPANPPVLLPMLFSPSFLSSQHAYRSPQACRQSFSSSEQHSSLLHLHQMKSLRRQKGRDVFLAKGVPAEQLFFLFYQNASCRKGSQSQQHEPEINPAKGLALLSFLSASVSVPIFIGCC